MDKQLSEKRALVLGGSKGLGFGIAKGLAREGARVALTSRTAQSAIAAAQGLDARALGLACDTGVIGSIEDLAQQVAVKMGGVDILVLNSGGPPPGSARGVAPEAWRTAFEAMFVSLVRLTDLMLPGMIERGYGRIISIISSGVIEPSPNLAISNAIRPALVGWGKTLATEVARHGVTVNALAPGRIDTDRVRQLDEANAARSGRDLSEVQAASRARIPVGRYGTIEEYGAAAVFLASPAASFITGSILRVDGGQIAATN